MNQFSFGENWLRYSEILDEARVRDAEQSLQQLLGRERLDSCSLLDIGSGSALFAIAAVRLGASTVVAIDRDPNSVAAGRQNVSRFLDGEQRARVDIRSGDILVPEPDPRRYDIVYAWGSLHHTGAMWSAIDNASKYCADGGDFVLAIYNRTAFSPAWLRIKRFYNRAPSAIRLGMVAAMTAVRGGIRLMQLKHPFAAERGMSVWYDAADWLGGLPYECATPVEIQAFMTARSNALVRSFLTSRHGCNQFVFRREPDVVARSQPAAVTDV